MEAQLMQSGVFANIRAVATGFHEGRHCMSNLPKPLGRSNRFNCGICFAAANLPLSGSSFCFATLPCALQVGSCCVDPACSSSNGVVFLAGLGVRGL
eukprot:1158405-Pelagomonas_calceolata.AAC.1